MTQDDEFDVVVLGTGGAGLSAALSAAVAGARVALVEKAPTIGGTTAVSGGVTWIPAHGRAVHGEPLTREAARAYLDSMSVGLLEDDLIDAYIDRGAEAVDFLEQHSAADDGLLRDWPRPDAGVAMHESYSLQWYSFAALTVILLVALSFRRVAKG